MDETTTFTLTDAEIRAVLYACAVATDHRELWRGNETHRMAAVAGREKISAAYVAQEAEREAARLGRKPARR